MRGRKQAERDEPPRGLARRRGLGRGFRYKFEIRRKAVQLTVEEGIPAELVAKEMGVSVNSVDNWTRRYRAEGEAGLLDRPRNWKKAGLPEAVVDKIIELKEADPTQGSRKLSQILRRMFFMKASASAVGKHTKAHGLITPRKKKRRVQKLEDRRYEYSKPNAFWQSDITVFTIHDKPAFIIGFIDDYSRYITGIGLYRSQNSENVLEVYRRASCEHGVPAELLTDNGRQYASWRGKTKFQKELAKDHVHHIRSQPHHPQTLGKIERFWQTMKDEFLSRSKFETFDEAQQRLAYWVKHYNHYRPHQSLEGLCPADRFFKIKEQMKTAIEKNMTANMEELALHGKPIEPFYMVGQVNGQSLVIESDKKRFSVTVNGNEVQGTGVGMKGKASNESGSSDRIGGRTETAAPAGVRCEGKEPGGTLPVERKAQCLSPDERAVGALGSAARVGAACNPGDTDGAGPGLEAGKGSSIESAQPGGEADREDASKAAGSGSPDELKGTNHAEHGTGSVRSAGEMPGSTGDMDGEKEGVCTLPGVVNQCEPAVAVAGPGVVGYAGSPGAEGTGRQGRPCACPADQAVAGQEDQGAGTGVCRPSATAPAHSEGFACTRSHGPLTREVNELGNGGEGRTLAAGNPGSAGRATECDGSGIPARSEPEDLLRETGTGTDCDAGSLEGPADRPTFESSGSGEGRTPGGTGGEPAGAGTTGSQTEGAECAAAGIDGSRLAHACG